MTAKEYLKGIIDLRKAAAYRRIKIEALESAAERTTVPVTGMPRAPGADPSPLASVICKKVDLEREIAEIERKRGAVIEEIDLLENDEYKALLTLRYVEEMKWDAVMARMGYSETHIHRLHRSALEEFDKILKDGSRWQ